MEKRLIIKNESKVNTRDPELEVSLKDGNGEICFSVDTYDESIDLFLNVSQVKDLIDFLIGQIK